MSSLWALVLLVQAGNCTPIGICTQEQPSPAITFTTKAECERKGSLLTSGSYYCFEVQLPAQPPPDPHSTESLPVCGRWIGDQLALKQCPQGSIFVTPKTSDCDLMHPNMSCVDTAIVAPANMVRPLPHPDPPKPGTCGKVNSANQWVSIRCP